MTKWWPHIPAAIRLGLTWGAAWFAIGLILARVPGFYSDLPFALLFAPLGFLTGSLCSGLLQLFEGQPAFEGASVLRSSGWGAVSGLLLSALFVTGAAFRGAALWDEFLVFGPALATAGAASAVGSMMLARRVERREWRA